jgi:polysaccharide biosynthesis protein PslG
MRKLISILAVLASLTLSACQFPCASPEGWMFDYTGEEGLPRQVKGMGQLATNVLYPQPQTAPDVAVAHAGVNPFGINVFLNEEVEEWKRERSVQMIAEAGFHWLRQEFPWEDIEISARGDFWDHKWDKDAWEKYDHIVDLAERYGLEVVPRLSNPPAWTRAAGDAGGTSAPPDDLADWGNYVYAVVSRYRGRIRYYQLWNEPNIYPEWGEQPVDPEGYTRLLCEGYARAKEADPDVVIISGALAPTVSLNPGPGPALGLNEFIFLQRMYDAGASACFDIMAVNDYMLWSGPTDHRSRPLNINFSRPMFIRDIMVANGDAAKPIWISEMNSNAVPNDPANISGVGGYGMVTLEQQARYAPLAYQRAMEEWPWIGVVNFWFFKRADDSVRDQSWYYFRMVEPDFTPLPVYDTMREYITDLEPTLYPGYHQEDHWALVYEGEWSSRHADGSALADYQQTTEPGATASFVYEGAGLTLAPGPGTGEIEVSVNGGAPRRIALNGEPVQLVGGLGRTRHEIVLTAVSGDVGVDGFIVRQPWSPSPWPALGTIGVFAAVIILLWWVRR